MNKKLGNNYKEDIGNMINSIKPTDKFIYNKTKFQKESPNINTCGRWVIARLSLFLSDDLNLLYRSSNVGTKIGQLETSLNGKQATLIEGTNITIDQNTNTISSTGGGITTMYDGDLTIAKTNGLLDALDSKQSNLTPFSNLSINKVSTLSDITAGGNFFLWIIVEQKMLRLNFQQLIQQLILNKIK